MHKIVVNVQTGEVSKIEYTPEELAEHEAKLAAQEAATPAEITESVQNGNN